MARAYLSLGSNEGNREDFIAQAIVRLESADLTIDQCSSICETDPVDCPGPQNKYLNCVLKITTTLTPKKLLKHTQSVENTLGRKRPFLKAPRTIDIDILLYDDLKIKTKNLTIPHPRMYEREFVMKPFLELNKDSNQ